MPPDPLDPVRMIEKLQRRVAKLEIALKDAMGAVEWGAHQAGPSRVTVSAMEMFRQTLQRIRELEVVDMNDAYWAEAYGASPTKLQRQLSAAKGGLKWYARKKLYKPMHTFIEDNKLTSIMLDKGQVARDCQAEIERIGEEEG